jgi:hypothetical protein
VLSHRDEAPRTTDLVGQHERFADLPHDRRDDRRRRGLVLLVTAAARRTIMRLPEPRPGQPDGTVEPGGQPPPPSRAGHLEVAQGVLSELVPAFVPARPAVP